MKIHRSPSFGIAISTLCTIGTTASSFVLHPSSIIEIPSRDAATRPIVPDASVFPLHGGAQSIRSTRLKSAAAVDKDEDTPSSKQTIATATFNLIKGCVGAGVLSLPSGVAAIGDVPKAYVLFCSVASTFDRLFLINDLPFFIVHILKDGASNFHFCSPRID